LDFFCSLARKPELLYQTVENGHSALEASLRGAVEGRSNLPSFFSVVYLLGWYAFTEMQLASIVLPLLVQSNACLK
jgi:hypothetical protein